eukprot:COSAG06_NODE_671_length_13206_cov_477.269474_12_plen_87_part_00
MPASRSFSLEKRGDQDKTRKDKTRQNAATNPVFNSETYQGLNTTDTLCWMDAGTSGIDEWVAFELNHLLERWAGLFRGEARSKPAR